MAWVAGLGCTAGSQSLRLQRPSLRAWTFQATKTQSPGAPGSQVTTTVSSGRSASRTPATALGWPAFCP